MKEANLISGEALAAIPWDLTILDAAGQAQMRAGDIEQAATTFRKLATAAPTSPTPYLRLAELYAASGKRDQAESALGKALEIAPQSVEAQQALIGLYLSSSDQPGTVERIRRITQRNPKDALGYVVEAEYHVRRKDTDAALAALHDGLTKTRKPELAGRYYNLLMNTGRTVDADRFAASWIKQHPTDAAFEALMAQVDISRGALKVAEQRMLRVLAAYPNNVQALNNLAWLRANTGGKGAVDYAQRAVDLVPDNPGLMDTLALALASEGQTALALEVQKRAVELSPKDSLLRLTLVKVALQAGDKALAKQELAQLQKLGTTFPAHAEVGRLLQGL